MRTVRNPIRACCLAVGIFLALAAAKGFHPFGPYSILQIDLFHQYAPFQEELRSRLMEGKSLIYSWEGGLGKAFFLRWPITRPAPSVFCACSSLRRGSRILCCF